MKELNNGGIKLHFIKILSIPASWDLVCLPFLPEHIYSDTHTLIHCSQAVSAASGGLYNSQQSEGKREGAC